MVSQGGLARLQLDPIRASFRVGQLCVRQQGLRLDALPDIQLQRTRLAQSFSERSAAAERQQREEAERRAAQLQQQLSAEQANREAQAAEVQRLRQQIDDTRRAADERRAADRSARIDAEPRVDEAFRNYQSAIASEQGEGTQRVVAARAEDGSFLIAYTPVGQPLSIHMSKLSGSSVSAQWYDARNGTWKAIRRYSNKGIQEFAPPARGEQDDWVLVLDAKP